MFIDFFSNIFIHSLYYYSEHVTLSVFILAGSALKATVNFDGPLSSPDHTIDSGLALYEAVDHYDRGWKTIEGLRYSDTVDFEHLNIDPPEEDDDEIAEAALAEADNGGDEEESMEERKQRRAVARRKALEIRERREAHKRKQKNKIRQEGEPWEETLQAPATGWYRFCISGTWYQVIAEIDIRKESEFGGIDEDTGHVWSMQERTLEDEEKLMLSDTAANEGIKDEDFEATRDKLKTLRRLLAEIQSKQSQERHRLIVHAATNEHSHSRMVLSSLLETVLFMAVTGFQVYTIRRWFKSAPVLGR